MKKYILFILILLIGTSINIAPEEGHFDYSKETSKHTTSFASWIESHNLVSEKDRAMYSRASSEAELLAILDSGLTFNMPLPLIGASEGLVHLIKIENAKELALKEEKAKEEILKAEQAKAKALELEEQAKAEQALALAQKALEEAEQERIALAQKELEEKLALEAQKAAIAEAERVAEEEKLVAQNNRQENEIQKEILQEENNKPNALENDAEKETTDTSLEASTVVKTEESKKSAQFPQELPSENVDMIQFSAVQEGDRYIAIFTLLNKVDEVQSGKIHYSISFEDGETMPFVGYVGTYRFKMQVPKTYPLALSQEMIAHAKVSAPRLITIYLLNNRDEVFFRKNIMITN